MPPCTVPETTATRNRLAASVIDELLPRWEKQPNIRLDLSEYAAVERGAAAVLTCALAGTLGDRPLEVVAAKGAHLDWLEASGLAFALTHRSGPTRVETGSPGTAWERDWSPGFGSPWSDKELPGPESLFPPEAIGETSVHPDLVGPGFAAFVNPHLTRRRAGKHPIATVLWPWLTRLTSVSRAGGANAEARDRLVADIGRLVNEIVTNVGDHATVNGPISSLVQVSVTRGGGGRSRNRLHVAVTDTGPGIAATARLRLAGAEQEMRDDVLLRELLNGVLGPWGRGRGQGLPRVVELCRRHAAVLRIATRDARVLLEPGEDVIAGPSDFSLHGTVVTLTIPLAT